MSESTAAVAVAPPAVAAVKPKKKFNLVLLLVPVAVIAALVLAFALPPTHALIVNGPLKPMFTKLGMAGASSVHAPADPAADVKRLGDELESARKTEAAKDARIAQLQSEVSAAQAPPPDASPTPLAKPSPTAVPASIKRVAAYWAEMDAEKAAAIAARLPDVYVKDIFGQMPADAVAEIMNAMPAKAAAKLMANVDPTDAPTP